MNELSKVNGKVSEIKRVDGEMDWGRKWTHGPRRSRGTEWKMGINVDSVSVGRPSTSTSGSGDSPGGERLLRG